MDSSRLPLRLAAEPACRKVLGRAVAILGLRTRCCVVLCDGGVAALVVEAADAADAALHSSSMADGAVPEWLLVRSGASLSWRRGGAPAAAPERKALRGSSVVPGVALAKLIISATHEYYAQQCLEPSVRGFLGILEKQFPRRYVTALLLLLL